ncbi:MAG: alkaline phosphatase family protein [Planctomycetota bacterium]|jgi:predicted AlkP superfamily phosphohydrolase/phosphomutase
MIRRFLPLLVVLAATASALPLSAFQQGQADRVIVLGMDGMDAEMAGDWMEAGELPNFTRLRERGTFAPLMPANPAQSPVSWATLNTGVNPGKHGIFDFVGISRDGGRKNPVAPGIGFQSTRKITAAEAGLPYTDSSKLYMLMGGGAVVGLILLLGIGRFHKLGGLVVGLGVAGGSVWYALSWMGAYPEQAFSDYTGGNRAETYWETLDDAGIPFRGQGTIVAYPAQELEHGKVIAGLGAPDAKGGLNSSAIYTTAKNRKGRRKDYAALPASTIETAEDLKVPSGKRAGTTRVFEFTEGAGGVLESHLFGPLNLVLQEGLRAEQASLSKDSGGNQDRLKEINAILGTSRNAGNTELLNTSVPMSARWNKGASVSLTVDGATQEIAMNSWSDFYEVEFPWSPRFSTWAMIRFWAEERDGELEIFASPLQIDPDHPTPGSRICWPPEFAVDLESRIGKFETLGWACQTHAVKDAELSDDAFLADIDFTLSWRMKLLEDAVAQGDWKVLFHFFGTPDRICHMLMRHMDPLHPQYDEAAANRVVQAFGREFALKDSGLVIYQEMDKIVGYMLDEVLADEDVLMIVSDHGFDSFRRQVDLNAWLAQEGFLTIANRSALGVPRPKKNVRASQLKFVDWGDTQAYSVAIGKIYLNLRGREAKGIVDEEEADKVLAEISAALYAMVDPQTGEKVVKKVYLRDELYDGPYVHRSKEGGEGAAEITIDFYPGYRASWGVTGGGITLVDGTDEEGNTIALAGDFLSDNDYAWSGDHCGVDIHSVQGIFFSNHPMALPEGDTWYDATHLAPTVLSLQGVKKPQNYDRDALLLQ